MIQAKFMPGFLGLNPLGMKQRKSIEGLFDCTNTLRGYTRSYSFGTLIPYPIKGKNSRSGYSSWTGIEKFGVPRNGEMMQSSPFYLKKKFPLFDRREGMTLYQQRKKIIRGSYNVDVVLVAFGMSCY